MTNLRDNLGPNLRRFRQEKNLTLEQLAHTSKVSISTITRIENKSFTGDIGLSVIQRLAEALGIAPLMLLDTIPSTPSILDSIENCLKLLNKIDKNTS